jgi:Flp pilus assembly pilin Flp
MSTYIQIIKALVSDRRGVTAMEYAVVVGVVTVVALSAFTILGGKLTSTLTGISL